jgi:hypothetical protein
MLLYSMIPLDEVIGPSDVVMVHHHLIKREHWCPLIKPLLPLSHHYTLAVVGVVAVVVLAPASCCKPLGSKT